MFSAALNYRIYCLIKKWGRCDVALGKELQQMTKRIAVQIKNRPFWQEPHGQYFFSTALQLCM